MKAESPISAATSGPLIVVGIWRSGTSLLYSLLNQNPQIALMYEADLYLLQPLFSRKGSSADWLARWEFWNSALSRHKIDTKNFPAAVADFPSGARAVWKQYADGAAVMGEKSPNYYDCLQDLARQFPGIRVIVIWRDLADICRSMVRARSGSTFFSKPGILHRAIIGFGKLKRERDALVARNIPLHEIQYEEMIQEPARVMTGVCEFLQIPFDSRMTSLQGVDSSPIYDGSHHIQVKAGNIVRGKNAREVLSPRMKSKISSYVGYWQKQSGGVWPLYPKSSTDVVSSPNAFERFCDEFLFCLLRILDEFTAFVYCYAPFGLLQKYRSFKNRRFTEAIKKGPIQSDVIPKEAS